MDYQKIDLPWVLIRFLTKIYYFNKFNPIQYAFQNKISNKTINNRVLEIVSTQDFFLMAEEFQCE